MVIPSSVAVDSTMNLFEKLDLFVRYMLSLCIFNQVHFTSFSLYRDLAHNDLVSVEKTSLTKLPKLRQLLLDHNKISYIEEGTFAHLPALQIL